MNEIKKFCVVLKYELKEYFSNKAFMGLTLFLAAVGAFVLFLPRFVDLSGFTGVKIVGGEQQEESSSGDRARLLYVDKAGVVREELLREFFPDADWEAAADEAALQAAVEAQEAEAGFVVTAPTEYTYYVYNRSMTDTNASVFEEALRMFYRMDYCRDNGLDLEEITAMYQVPIQMQSQILNKDSGSNYWYCYMLVIIVFMLIVYYGQMIAVSVTNEKSNRAIEVLVTSTSPNSLLFGKVVAGAIAGVFQMGVLLGAILIAYQANREQWGGMLDMFLHIPMEVIVAFAFFGLGGYLFYAFLYGAMGALVSKTEDVSKSASGLMVVVMVVYFFSLVQLTNVDGLIIRILSFLPVSSYNTMFARIAMGTVSMWEIIVSFLILVVSILGTGILGAKLYRMGTLRYGNPIRLGKALKDLRKDKV